MCSNFIFYFAILLFLVSNSNNSLAQNSQLVNVRYINHNPSGIVTLETVAFGKKSEAKIAAQQYAFEVLLFRGLPNAPISKLRYPMIKDEQKARKNHPDFFETFFQQQGYQTYIQSLTSPQKQKVKARQKKKGFTLIMTIQYEQLLRYLKQHKIASKMGVW